MKALILAAGYAKRLWPLTLNQPKPLLKIGGTPIIERIIDKIYDVEKVDRIYIVTNHKFKPNFDDWLSGYNTKKEIEVLDDGTLSNEDRLGAIRDMNFVINRESIDDDLLVIAGDTLFDLNFNDLVDMAYQKNASVTVAKEMDKSKIAGRYGNLILGGDGRIVEFEEKPAEPKSPFASVPIYLFKKETLSFVGRCVRENPNLDNSGDFIKYLIEKHPVFCYVTQGEYIDIGKLSELNEADIKYGGKGEYKLE
ncbi:nucleotidyltransferase family protein [Candidatus Woesearchaeota archaeon]|nr:nucleotidyltransferase family protein [Candidatus Woesearchaeota archaeon]